MASNDIVEQYFTFEGRLASYQSPPQLPKRRASNANSKTLKPTKWPHKFLSAKDLAAAGFFYNPRPANPDNVTCFLCHKSLDGWEADDDPLVEHLKHSQECGWAVVATIEAQDGVLNEEFPSSARMLDARKATFGNQWPHESKKGWKCKVKQMVEAGWKYTPTPESDDMATCAYCSLALDGWEPGDKPMEEHYSRSSDCSFFSLINDHKQTAKKPKSQKDRTSKASRLSTQSAITVGSECQSIVDMPAEDDDSILTTATNATQTGKKIGKGKKAANTKTKRTRAKKAEHIEREIAPEPEDVDFEVKVNPALKVIESKKRKSDHEKTSITEAPSPKRRATRSRGSIAVNASTPNEILSDTYKPKSRKGRNSTKTTREVSIAPIVQAPEGVSADDEIDMALEADLQKNLSGDEGKLVLPHKKTRNNRVVNAGNAMFGAGEVVIDDAVIEAELEAMELDSTLLLKAKGAKGKQSRKPSAKQQAAMKKTAERKDTEQAVGQKASNRASSELERNEAMQQFSPIAQSVEQKAMCRPNSRMPLDETIRSSRASVIARKKHKAETTTASSSNAHQQGDDSGNDTDASMASQSTVVRGGRPKRGKNAGKTEGGAENADEDGEKIGILQDAQLSQSGKDDIHGEELGVENEDSLIQVRGNFDDEREVNTTVPEVVNALEKSAKLPSRPQIQQTLTAMMENRGEDSNTNQTNNRIAKVSPTISTIDSTTPPPKYSIPSASPQSSDAENHPPSSKPSSNTKSELHKLVPTRNPTTLNATATRVPLAGTPVVSPSRRNVIAGLRSAQPWTSVDLDTIFLRSPRSGENIVGILGETLTDVRNGKLTSPEMKMSVEEWILYNASRAEEKLRSECEGMVGRFEREGGRAMRALEEVECIE